jgi:hypothetical protein
VLCDAYDLPAHYGAVALAHSEPQATLERRIRVRTDLQALDGDVGDVAETARFTSSILLLLTELCDALLGRVSLMAGSRVGNDEAEEFRKSEERKGCS